MDSMLGCQNCYLATIWYCFLHDSQLSLSHRSTPNPPRHHATIAIELLAYPHSLRRKLTPTERKWAHPVNKPIYSSRCATDGWLRVKDSIVICSWEVGCITISICNEHGNIQNDAWYIVDDPKISIRKYWMCFEKSARLVNPEGLERHWTSACPRKDLDSLWDGADRIN